MHDPYQLLAEMVSELGDEVEKAVEGVSFSMLLVIFICVIPELVVDRCQQLIHALHILQTSVQLRKHK